MVFLNWSTSLNSFETSIFLDLSVCLFRVIYEDAPHPYTLLLDDDLIQIAVTDAAAAVIFATRRFQTPTREMRVPLRPGKRQGSSALSSRPGRDSSR